MEDAIFWIFFAAILLLLAIFPEISYELCRIFGIMSPSNLVFLVIIFLLYWLVFLVIPGYDGAVSALVRFYLPASLYAVLFLPLFFFPLRALGRKLKNPLSTNEEPSVIL